jgi:predicted aldo/keto reductase-like oxidoreductase
MIYRPVGKTGMSAGIIGLGGEHLDNKPFETVDAIINTALDNGVNIMDVFMPGDEVRTNIGRALAGRRDKMLIQGHLGSTDIKQQYDQSRDLPSIKTYFESLLRCLKTDYIDFGMLFFIDSEKDFSDMFDGPALEYALKLKEEGKIRAIGASSHNPVIARRVVETGMVDLLLFSINPAFDMAPSGVNVLDYLAEDNLNFEKNLDPGRAALYKLCEQKSVAITVMKTLGAGKLLDPRYSPFGKPLSAVQCIHYALSRPGVVSALLGCSTREQVLEALGYLNATEEEKDYSGIVSKYQGGFKGSCVYCSHCLPCPAEINIAEVNKYLDAALLDPEHIPQTVTERYKALKHQGSECIACGSCEKKCPFSVPVIERMKKAAALFGL